MMSRIVSTVIVKQSAIDKANKRDNYDASTEFEIAISVNTILLKTIYFEYIYT